jgi:hypothetical protein
VKTRTEINWLMADRFHNDVMFLTNYTSLAWKISGFSRRFSTNISHEVVFQHPAATQVSNIKTGPRHSSGG